MKDIISELSLSETKKEATRLWHEYKAASKAYKDPIYDDLQKVYNQVKGGKKVIDIFKVIQKGGVIKPGYPRLAIVKAKTKKVFCTYFTTGSVHFKNENRFAGPIAEDISLIFCLPEFKFTEPWKGSHNLEAPVPMIPFKILPQKLTDDYYILWEVDEWKMVPPTDPYLLKRITKNMFVVLAGWDLTEIEKSVMAGRMH